jgi:hypothetical protein
MKTEVEQAVFRGEKRFQQWIEESEADYRACTRVQKVLYDWM